MQRFGIGVVYHQNQRTVACGQCGAAWQERFIGVSYFNSDGRKSDGESHLCPRCIMAPLTVDFVIERSEERRVGKSDGCDGAQVRKDTIARYEEFLASVIRSPIPS